MGSEPNTRKRTLEILRASERRLHGPARRTRIAQRLRRWTGQAHFILHQESRRPTEVNTAGLKIEPLWHSEQRGPNDLDLPRPTLVTRRYTLGLTWTVSHIEDELRTVVILVVDTAQLPWLVLPGAKPFPATSQGWSALVAETLRQYPGYRGGRWHGSG